MPRKTITNFDEFLQSLALGDNDYKEINDLYKAIENKGGGDMFKVEESSNKSGQLFVTPFIDNGYVLNLASEEATKHFLDTLEKRYTDGADMDSWFNMKYQMEKED